MQALNAATAATQNAREAFRQGMGRHLSLPMAKLLIVAFVAWLFVLWGASSVTQDITSVSQQSYNHAYVQLVAASWSSVGWVCFIGVVLIALAATALIVLGHYRPRHTPFTLSGAVSIVSMVTMSVMLHLHALKAESGLLWLLAGASALVTLLTTAIITSVLGWLIQKAASALEVALEILAPIAAAAPGITMENFRERLGRLIDVVDEDMWRQRVGIIPVVATIVYVPWHLMMYYSITTSWALVLGGIYAVITIFGFVTRMAGEAEFVDQKQRAFLKFMMVYGWVPLLGGPAYRIYVGDNIKHGVTGQGENSSNWFSDILHGADGFAGGYSWWGAIIMLLIAATVTMIIWGATQSWNAGRVKGVVLAAPVLFVLYSLLALVVSMGIWGHPQRGITLREVAAKTTDQKTVITVPVEHDKSETSVKLQWATDRTTNCMLEIIRLRYDRDKDFEHEVYRTGRMVQAQANPAAKLPNGWFNHQAILKDLSPGMVVYYRIRATQTAGEHQGIVTESPIYNTSIVPNVSALARLLNVYNRFKVRMVVAATKRINEHPKRAYKKSVQQQRCKQNCWRVADAKRAQIESDFDQLGQELGVD
ncbi:MAG: hypothetical protein ABII13_04470 [Patescibacteria group bacterium]